MPPVKWIYWSALSALGRSSNTTALSAHQAVCWHCLCVKTASFLWKDGAETAPVKKNNKKTPHYCHIIMPMIYLIAVFCIHVMQMCYSLSECWISSGKNLYLMFFASPFDHSIGSMSSPARWASASFTQGSRSMDEVRELLNMVPHIGWCCGEGCAVTKREFLMCVFIPCV